MNQRNKGFVSWGIYLSKVEFYISMEGVSGLNHLAGATCLKTVRADVNDGRFKEYGVNQ